ncbi:MAG: toxin-antitoxin system HicB family antitoxin [Atopobiaceae bacterium]|nr:toxin-antitoxin system HicB family antitoxin [Atopobiaceae bacterium]
MEQIYKKYTYRVRWSEEDSEYLATVAEFPSLSWLEEEQADALAGITNLVKEVLEDMAECGEEIPVPYSTREYSGNVRLRIPPEQHRELAIRAAEENVSLNRLICALISRPVEAQRVSSIARATSKPEQSADSTAEATAIRAQQAERFRLVVSNESAANTASETERLIPKHTFEEWPKEM